MAVRPVYDPLDQRSRHGRFTLQSFGKGLCFIQGEIRQLNLSADARRSGPKVLHQVRWHVNAQQTKRNSIELGILGAAVITFANGGKKFIRREGKTSDGIQFVDKDNER